MTRFVLFGLMVCSVAYADVPDKQIHEVNHLLSFIKKSGCVVNRNGGEYSAEKGSVHIENKYKYFKNKIKNTEDFIEYSATKSTMSGKYYMVTCPGKEAIRTQDWLLAELQKYRFK